MFDLPVQEYVPPPTLEPSRFASFAETSPAGDRTPSEFDLMTFARFVVEQEERYCQQR